MKDAEAQQGPQTPEHWNVFDEIVRIQDVLRGAVRRCFQDDKFREIFADDALIRSRWPV